MPEHDRDNAQDNDALDRYWDSLVDNDHRPTPLDTSLADTVQRVHRLPDAPDPDRSFVARLEDQLMQTATAATATPHAVATPDRALPRPAWRNHRRTTPRPARVALWRRAVELAALAALLLVIAAGTFFGRGLLPERDTAAPSIAPAALVATSEPYRGDGTAMYLGNAARTGEVPGSGPDDKPERVWGFELNPSRYGAGWNEPVISDGTAYMTGHVYGDNGLLQDALAIAVDTTTGTERWRVHLADDPDPDSVTFLSTPAIAGDLVYVGIGIFDTAEFDDGTDPQPSGALLALDARTGAERWRMPTGALDYGGPAIADGVIYSGTEDGTLAAFDAVTGEVRWQSPAAAMSQRRHRTPSPISVANGLLYVVDNTAELHAIDVTDGTERWRFARPGTELTIPVVANGLMYVGSNTYGEGADDVVPGRLHALDATTGEEQWTYDVRYYVDGVTTGQTSLVYLFDSKDEDARQLVALDGASGQEQWRIDAGSHNIGNPVLANNVLYFVEYHRGLFGFGYSMLGAGTSLHALDAASGRERWTTDVPEVPWIGPAVGDGKVFLIDSDDSGRGQTLLAYGDED